MTVCSPADVRLHPVLGEVVVVGYYDASYCRFAAVSDIVRTAWGKAVGWDDTHPCTALEFAQWPVVRIMV